MKHCEIALLRPQTRLVKKSDRTYIQKKNANVKSLFKCCARSASSIFKTQATGASLRKLLRAELHRQLTCT